MKPEFLLKVSGYHEAVTSANVALQFACEGYDSHAKVLRQSATPYALLQKLEDRDSCSVVSFD